mmetsp:Transcript_64090/g.149246  ORF Transcript_64090/g.149246 Transcript_64090/m.149246 type:complete len:145 (+) Transcript_64090:83-517(+)
METDVVYLPDDEAHVPPEDLSALLAEGTSASVMEFCARGPSAALLLGCMLLAAATLIAAIRFTWHVYAEDIAEFYCEAAGSDGTGPLFPSAGCTGGLGGGCGGPSGFTGGGAGGPTAGGGGRTLGHGVGTDDAASDSTTARSAR